MLSTGSTVVGFLRMGIKHLYAMGLTGGHFQISPLCVLDFYVNESCQRNGFGKEIFEFMLSNEPDLAGPHKLAYDRPSSKLRGFLQKHYRLHKIIPQANNFLIFQEFGLSRPQTPAEGRRAYGTMTRRNAGQRLEPIMPYKLAPLISGPMLDISIEEEIEDDVPVAIEKNSTIPAIRSQSPSECVVDQPSEIGVYSPRLEREDSEPNQTYNNTVIEQNQPHCEVEQDCMIDIIQKHAIAEYPQSPPASKSTRYTRSMGLPTLPAIASSEDLVNPFSSPSMFADFRRKNHNKQVIDRRASFRNHHESSLFQGHARRPYKPFEIEGERRSRYNKF
jgi:hypothetical protein